MAMLNNQRVKRSGHQMLESNLSQNWATYVFVVTANEPSAFFCLGVPEMSVLFFI